MPTSKFRFLVEWFHSKKQLSGHLLLLTSSNIFAFCNLGVFFKGISLLLIISEVVFHLALFVKMYTFNKILENNNA